ncbi:fungal-specific transcription factor domain-containing protein [Desarmillaria tabescens]|uniref:Fungal-specific transcription factor domain-containing protein n=1 Tax=Armillaria tabescens TaxID=1929756 RepID=A0AA39TJG2_ARMTA|nr:fungal-specific transcription factor domain-containing protein [Desarmillaria tabescens]KAK0461217.1 fungal-specific transcription factor domain-containing protein [Desarmillaria tabescens]
MAPGVYSQLSNQEKIDIRRIRGQLSCAECRRLKLKCDKHVPCASCVRRGCESICPTGTLSNCSGKKLVISETGTLHQKVEEMGQRIQELEEALRDFQASTSTEPHPLLRQELLVIKYPPGMALPSTQTPDNTTMELSDALGTLTIGDHGDAKYFGHSAGTESLLLAGAEMQGSSIDNSVRVIHRLSPNFPLDNSSGWDIEQSLEILYGFLPSKHRAWSLCETFHEHGIAGNLIMERSEIIAELLTPIYRYLGDGKQHRQGKPPPLSCHKLAVLFLVFGLGALVDLTLPPYNTEADNYFDLGCAALNLHHIFKNPEMATVQAVSLMAVYVSHGGRRFSVDGAWTLTSMAAKLAQSLGLHRESSQWTMDAKTLNKRRKIFWEVFYIDTFMSLTLGRPPSIRLSYVNCQFPIDDEETLDNDGNRLPGYSRYRYDFTKKIVAKVVELVLGAKPPSYQTILELDKEFRQMRLPHHISAKKNRKLEELSTPSEYMRGHFLSRLRAMTGLYIHRPFFVQAILGHPADPLCSPFAASYLAAYRCASGIIQFNVKHFAKFPLLLMRWWTIWSGLFSAAVVVATIATRAPPSPMASKAFADLGLVVDLFEKGALHSVRARSGLTILRPLRDKAVSIFSQRQDPSASNFPDDSNESNAAADLELEIFGGHTKVIVSKMLSQRRTFKAAEPPTSMMDSTPDPSSMPDESLVDYVISHIGDHTLYQSDDIPSATYTSNPFSSIPTTYNDPLQDPSFESMDFSMHPTPPFFQQQEQVDNPTMSSFLSMNPDNTSDSSLMQLLDFMPPFDNTQSDARMSDEHNDWSSFMPEPPTMDVPTPNFYDM